MPTSSYGVSCWKGIMQMMEKFKAAIRVEVGSRVKTFDEDIMTESDMGLC